MTEGSFDPYQQWLGIGSSERPVDHYTLLGVDRFVDDPEFIRLGAERQIAKVRQHEAGPYAPLCQRLIHELNSARQCLSDPISRTAYDETLPQQTPKIVTTSVLDSPSAPFQPSPPPVQSGTDSVAAPPQADSVEPPPLPVEESRTAFWPIAIGATIVLLATVAAIVFASLSKPATNARKGEQVDKQNDRQTSKGPAETDQEQDATIVIRQEGSGEIRFPISVATISGDAVQLQTLGDESVATNWAGPDDVISWRFDLVRPGFYRAELSYSVEQNAAGGRVVLKIDGEQKLVFELRSGEGPATFVTDFDFIAIKRSGEHQLSLQPLESKGRSSLALKSVRLSPHVLNSP